MKKTWKVFLTIVTALLAVVLVAFGPGVRRWGDEHGYDATVRSARERQRVRGGVGVPWRYDVGAMPCAHWTFFAAVGLDKR